MRPPGNKSVSIEWEIASSVGIKGGIGVLETAFAGEEDGAAFVCTAKLHGGEADLLRAALGACLLDRGLGVDVGPVDSLNVGLEFLSELGREVGRLGLCSNRLGANVCIDFVSLESCTALTKSTPAAMSLPLLSAPQQSQVRVFFSVPIDAGRRLPQSVQKTRVPMADMAAVGSVCADIECLRAFGVCGDRRSIAAV